MRKALLILALLWAVVANAQVGTQHYNPFETWMAQGVYRIIIQNTEGEVIGFGTAFIIEYNNRKYVVTAKHVVENRGFQVKTETDSIYTLHKYTLTNSKVSESFIAPFYYYPGQIFDISISVLKSSSKLLAIPKPSQSEGENIKVGNYAVFVGYPALTIPAGINILCSGAGGGCGPFVKIGRISAYDLNNILDPAIIIDAMNATGFSGSPAYAYDDKLKQFVLIGVVTSYLNQAVSIASDYGYLASKELYSNSGLTNVAAYKNIFNMIDALIKDGIIK